MKTKEYQGWASYETWNVILFLNNDQGTYNTYRLMAKKYIQDKGKLLCKDASFITFRCLGNYTKDGVSLDNKNIKWSEIRDAMLESIKE